MLRIIHDSNHLDKRLYWAKTPSCFLGCKCTTTHGMKIRSAGSTAARQDGRKICTAIYDSKGLII